MSINQAMVLAAGFGKRLRPLTLTTPKPLVPLVGKPMIAHVLERLQRHGIHRVVVNTHHLADQLADYLHTFSKGVPELEITISHESELLETGGGVLKVLSYFNGRPFFVVNADTWWQETEIPLLQRLESYWNEEIMDALLAIAPKSQGIEFSGAGDYYQDETGHLLFRALQPQAPYVFIGARILHSRLFDGVAPGFLTQPTLFHQAEAKQKLYGVVHKGKWCDVGSLNTYQALQDYLAPASHPVKSQSKGA